MAKGELAGRIQEATVAAMKARDKERLGIMRMLQAAIKQIEVDKRVELDESAVLQVVSSYARKVKDQLDSYRDGGREDLCAKVERELAIVTDFLPAELTEAELTEVVQGAIAESGAESLRDLGKVMKLVMPRVAGRAEGGRVSGLVKKLLQS